MVFEHSQTMKFTRQHKLIGFAVHSLSLIDLSAIVGAVAQKAGRISAIDIK